MAHPYVMVLSFRCAAGFFARKSPHKRKDPTQHDVWHPPHLGPWNHEVKCPMLMWSFGPRCLGRTKTLRLPQGHALQCAQLGQKRRENWNLSSRGASMVYGHMKGMKSLARLIGTIRPHSGLLHQGLLGPTRPHWSGYAALG